MGGGNIGNARDIVKRLIIEIRRAKLVNYRLESQVGSLSGGDRNWLPRVCSVPGELMGKRGVTRQSKTSREESKTGILR
ncbi:MAG: hypothetical protein A2X67_04345 [Ignavibacteria bacterium GWA2_55_11]|nr:MAG: hypothetical protein A2X67_04345 [Ignavibacteria bacterium GWA2_55_11]OGU47089.1 MAG: hypothetical protein A2X68_08635 [Ignavibacteria bacterium GWC2_56_12]OGU73083.1 MAG: hypothetical protein A3H45_00250 [Ignavibacteria bacterium RIFCSPLOWO2_02_FULL_55_14]